MREGAHPHTPSRNRRLLLLAGATGLCLALALGAARSAYAENEDGLSVGEWSGTYQLSGSDPTDATYEVNRDADSGEWSIVMTLDLEPKEEFTYRFDNLVVAKDGLRFRYGTGKDVRECDLRLTGAGEFHGDCVGAEQEEDPPRKVRLVMRPPLPPSDTQE